MSEAALENPPAIENPVIQPDIEFSKPAYRDAMAAEQGNPPAEPPPPVETPSIDANPSKPAAEPTPVVETPEAPVVETPPTAKGKVPDELISGKKPEPKF